MFTVKVFTNDKEQKYIARIGSFSTQESADLVRADVNILLTLLGVGSMYYAEVAEE
jgi:cell division protein FtsN